MSLLMHFDFLTAQGLQIIPLREGSKIPLNKGWGSAWDRKSVRRILENQPYCNIGLLLGEVVDVEGDSEEANHLVEKLTINVAHPCYRSSRSVHHLFQTPRPGLRFFRYGQVEFRGCGHQSVLPPSRTSETEYIWLTSPQTPLPPMPPALAALLKTTDRISNPDYVRPMCPTCRRPAYLHKRRHLKEVKACELLSLAWECPKCRPVDLRKWCRRLRH